MRITQKIVLPFCPDLKERLVKEAMASDLKRVLVGLTIKSLALDTLVPENHFNLKNVIFKHCLQAHLGGSKGAK